MSRLMWASKLFLWHHLVAATPKHAGRKSSALGCVIGVDSLALKCLYGWEDGVMLDNRQTQCFVPKNKLMCRYIFPPATEVGPMCVVNRINLVQS